jgi:hypothetical protein
LVGDITQISVGRVVTIIHKLHSHHFKHTIIFKILMDMHSYVPPPKRILEETLHAFIEKQETINTQLAQTMTDFKDTLAKFTSALSFQEKGKFSSQP